MADDGEYDPNVGVAGWVNVLVPILSALVFTLTLVWLYFTKCELDVETIQALVERLPWSEKETAEEITNQKESHRKAPVYKISGEVPPVTERSTLNGRQNRGYQNDTGSTTSYGSVPYFYGSQGTMVSFESQV